MTAHGYLKVSAAALIGFLWLSLSSCLQTENSSSSDEFLTVSAGLSTLSKSCSSCHSYHTMTAEQLIQAGVIIRGNPEASQLYYRMTGSLGANGPKNMPPTGALSEDEVDAFGEWIEGL